MKFVTTKNPLKNKHDRFGEISATVEYPQAENYSELVQYAGGEDSFFTWANRKLRDDALKAGRTAFRNDSDTITQEDLISSVQRATKNYVPTTERQSSDAVELKGRINAVAEKLKSGEVYSREELLAMLEGAA